MMTFNTRLLLYLHDSEQQYSTAVRHPTRVNVQRLWQILYTSKFLCTPRALQEHTTLKKKRNLTREGRSGGGTGRDAREAETRRKQCSP